MDFELDEDLRAVKTAVARERASYQRARVFGLELAELLLAEGVELSLGSVALRVAADLLKRRCRAGSGVHAGHQRPRGSTPAGRP